MTEPIYLSLGVYLIPEAEANPNPTENRKTGKHIPEYKMKRFWFRCRSLFHEPEKSGRTDTSIVYSLVNQMIIQGFQPEEIHHLIFAWHRKHGKTISKGYLDVIINEATAFTLEFRRKRERERKARYRARKRQQATAKAEVKK